MRRVTAPLTQMGARFSEFQGDGLPLTVEGGPLVPIAYRLPVSSAQIKGALLLAGLAGGVAVELIEPNGSSRDHTERLLRGLGFAVGQHGDAVRFDPAGRVEPFELTVPGDFSSAAFLMAAALMADRGELTLDGVGLNPTRTGFLDVVRRMGATVESGGVTEALGEPVGTLVVRPSPLHATEVVAREIPGLIDEVPMLAVLAARAEGTSVFRDVGELRVKESNRLELVAENLRAVGMDAEVSGNDLHVTGRDRPPAGRVRTAGDHRLAMAFAVLGTLPGARVDIDDLRSADVSFPHFEDVLTSIAVDRAHG